MKYLEFEISNPLNFNMTGKFIAPDKNWIHMTRTLYDFEFIFVTKGTLYIATDNIKYAIHEGEYLICQPICQQYGYNSSLCEFYWSHFSYNEVKNNPKVYTNQNLPQIPYPLNSSKIFLPITGSVPKQERLIILLKQLQDDDRRYKNLNLNSYILTSALSELYSQIYLTHSSNNDTYKNSRLYSDILDYISWRINENIKVSDIADYLGFNAKYITTFFKRGSGMSIKQYILREKINIAKAQLTDSHTPIGIIGLDLGFSDCQSFSNTFRKLTGQSPSSYRNTYALSKEFHV